MNVVYELPVVKLKMVVDYSVPLSHQRIYGIEEAKSVFYQIIGESTLEKLAVICLNTDFMPTSAAIINIGTEKNLEVSVTELFRIAILSNAVSIIICHNHPSGNVQPSQYDIDITKKIGKLGSMMGVSLIDSIIISHNKQVYSIRQSLNP